MESTVTENGALFFAQHRVAKRRAAFFRRWRKPKKDAAPDIRVRRSRNSYIVLPLHRDNGG